MASNDDAMRTVAQQVLAEMHRVAAQTGRRLDDPVVMQTVLHELQHLAAQAASRAGPDPDGLEEWQRASVVTFMMDVLALAPAALAPRSPQTALLLTITEDHTVHMTLDEDVQVQVMAAGTTRLVRPSTLVATGTSLRDVEQPTGWGRP